MKIRISVASLLALAMIFALLLPVHAETISDSGWDSETSGDGTATLSEGNISLSATGYKNWFSNKTRTATIKITNNTGEAKILTGKMEFGGSFGSFTITLPDGTPKTGNTAYTYEDSITLENGQSLTISVTSPSGSGTITCTYEPTVSPRVAKTITCNTGSNGSYSVNGTSITVDNTQITYNVGDSITIEPTPDSGYVCLGFMLNETTLLPIGQTETFSWSPTDNYSIKPVFAQVATSSAPFKVNGTRYYTWETAMTAAGSSGIVVLAEDFTLPATYAAQGMTGAGNHVTGTDNALVYAVPAGVSLLIPYDDNNLVIQSAEADAAHANYLAYTTGVSPKGLPLADVYRTLTIPQGTTVKLSDSTGASARLVVGGILGASEGNGYREGGTYGNHGNLAINGKLQLGNNSVLSACGYVIGSGDISTTGSGAAIYQPMVLNDWRGAGQASLATNGGTDELYNANNAFPSGETTVSPFSQWGFMNIRTDITLTEGNSIRAYCSLLEDSKLYTAATEIVSSSGLVILNSGATLTSKWQDLWTLDTNGTANGNYPYPGRNRITISGGASLGVLNMTIPDIGEFSTKDFTLPVCYNFDITLQGTADTPYTIARDVALLPGASITVDRGAVLKVTTSRFVILDGLTSRTISTVTQDFKALDGGTYAATTMALAVNTRSDGKSYPTAFELRSGGLTSNAKFVVNGSLSIGASTNFGGLIQSTTPTGTVSVGGTDGSEVSGSVMHGLIDRGWVNFFGRVFVGGTCHTLDAKVLSHDGTMTTLLRGDTYYSIEHSDYLEEYISDYYYGITSAGVLDEAYTFINQSATLKNDTYPDGQPINGAWCKHSWTDATCAAPETCSICKSTRGGTLPHTEVTDAAVAPTCTETGLTEGKHCSVCGTITVAQTEIAALGHSYESVETPPTCTEAGSTTYTCSVCGDSYSEPIAATGHNYEAVETAPTCTMPGYTTYTCSQEDHSYVVMGDPATGHSYGDDDICDVCDAEKPTVTFEVKHNLNLLDLIKIGYWFKAESTDEAIDLSNATYGIKVWKLGEDSSTASDITKLKERGGYMQGYGEGIFAQELDTVYCARPYVTVGEQIYECDVVDIFSVPMYASSAGFSSQPTVVQDAVRDLLNYATDAQFYFLVRNEGYTEETLKNRTPINSVLDDALKTTRYTEGMKVETPAEIVNGTLTCEWVSATINLEEAISLNFMAEDQTDFVGMVYCYGENYTTPEALTVETNNGVSDITRKGGYAIGKVGQIYAKDIGDWFYARMYSGTDGSYTYGPIRVDSVAAYLTRGITAMEGQTLTLEQQYMIDTFKDMLAYGNSAYAYAQTVNPIV